MTNRISLLLMLLVTISLAKADFSRTLQLYLDRTNDSEVTVWIFFKDKGPDPQPERDIITERALERRRKTLEKPLEYRYSDAPVFNPYIEKVKPYAQKIRVQSRWLNAISAEMERGMLNALEALPFIQKIDLVKAHKKREPVISDPPEMMPVLQKTHAFNYGTSLNQLEQIGVTTLHKRGLYGQGVLICMLDDGFNLYNTHQCFDSLDVVATWDFINNDDSVDDPEADPVEGWHGTKTLSVIGGYAPGELIGPAFRASYLLAKTEDDNGETPVEEDYWVAGIEWAEAMGADIASSSLGYIDWYTWEDMDGETPVTTIAADMAVENGMIVINSAGNEGYSSEHNTLIAPADGDYVIAAGAVTSDGARSGFSSVGPTVDGRIKPDVAAMGSSVRVASHMDTSRYTYSSGTSFSCPLVAGAVAQLLTADPDLTPAEVREALFATASQARRPDNLLGYGIIDISEAFDYLQIQLYREEEPEKPLTFFMDQNYPNPFNPVTQITFRTPVAGWANLQVYDITGRVVATPLDRAVKPGSVTVTFNAEALPSGAYFYRIELGPFRETRKMLLVR